MHSAGEKQFNVVALMETFFQHLPHNICVGLLYDVGCTFEHSCRKWGFLSHFLDRLAFVVSVFHAFGHEWACQLLYHPRKHIGFRFTNGEGCEHFWHSISHLIAHLRICGYHNRLYTLDTQIEHADKTSLLSPVPRRAGVASPQTQPGQACGSNKGFNGVRPSYCHTARTVAAASYCIDEAATDGQQAVSNMILLRGSLKLRRAWLSWTPWRRSCATKRVAERQDLKKLLNSQYMHLVMNVRALKLRLVQRLQHRKFEIDPVERACRQLPNDAKLHTHTEAAVKHREPNISRTCSEYNKLCTQLQKLINEGQAPRNAIAPLPIPAKGLWKLDVIFQNIGLDEREAGEAAAEPPLWLSDKRVRTGTKAMLEHDRCEEEDACLRREHRALQVWFAGEWEVINRALQDANSSEDKYHLKLRRNKLIRLCATWHKDLPDLGRDMWTTSAWGPSATQLARCQFDAHQAARGDDRHYGTGGADEDDVGDEAEAEGGGDEEDFGTPEALERADMYRNKDQL
ncbi:hypothetical protein B0H16DRAFT_1730084 [Mycena metata]|uniref:CxC2-like cysteine cluster KDZ transposase-associated domain-containing protein n=1 Tax=Mycena metata TaxID=1033252 RepID=A0AAD7I9R9_9AGAR|nr:hypothetical protein B0H16DRAFT_1730084 [Mycena metata]